MPKALKKPMFIAGDGGAFVRNRPQAMDLQLDRKTGLLDYKDEMNFYVHTNIKGGKFERDDPMFPQQFGGYRAGDNKIQCFQRETEKLVNADIVLINPGTIVEAFDDDHNETGPIDIVVGGSLSGSFNFIKRVKFYVKFGATLNLIPSKAWSQGTSAQRRHVEIYYEHGATVRGADQLAKSVKPHKVDMINVLLPRNMSTITARSDSSSSKPPPVDESVVLFPAVADFTGATETPENQTVTETCSSIEKGNKRCVKPNAHLTLDGKAMNDSLFLLEGYKAKITGFGGHKAHAATGNIVFMGKGSHLDVRQTKNDLLVFHTDPDFRAAQIISHKAGDDDDLIGSDADQSNEERGIWVPDENDRDNIIAQPVSMIITVFDGGKDHLAAAQEHRTDLPSTDFTSRNGGAAAAAAAAAAATAAAAEAEAQARAQQEAQARADAEAKARAAQQHQPAPAPAPAPASMTDVVSEPVKAPAAPKQMNNDTSKGTTAVDPATLIVCFSCLGCLGCADTLSLNGYIGNWCTVNTNMSCCCCRLGFVACRGSDIEGEICQCYESDFKQIMPSTCCMTTGQTCCLDQRIAFPAEDDATKEIPCALAMGGINCALEWQPRFACCQTVQALRNAEGACVTGTCGDCSCGSACLTPPVDTTGDAANGGAGSGVATQQPLSLGDKMGASIDNIGHGGKEDSGLPDVDDLNVISGCCCFIQSIFCQFPEVFGAYGQGIVCGCAKFSASMCKPLIEQGEDFDQDICLLANQRCALTMPVTCFQCVLQSCCIDNRCSLPPEPGKVPCIMNYMCINCVYNYKPACGCTLWSPLGQFNTPDENAMANKAE